MGLPLGGFYQDFTAALELVLGGAHGPMDPEGRPLYGHKEPHYNAIIISQYALACVPKASAGDVTCRERLRVQADWLVREQEKQGPGRGFWLQRFNNAKYPALRDPWVSALAQGNALSALLRAWEMLKDDAYLQTAALGFEALQRPVENGGVLWERDGNLWLEEYPLEPAGHVLNGAIYSLWGVLDFARATGDPGAWQLWRDGARTIAVHLEGFDTGFWSRYELATPELVSVHYHKNIHIPQLQAMHGLTGDARFERMALRWQRYLHSPLSWVRRRLEGRLRWQKTHATTRCRPGFLGRSEQ